MAASAPSLLLVIAALLAQAGEPTEPTAKDAPGQPPVADEVVEGSPEEPPPSEWDLRQASKQEVEPETSEEERSFIGQLAQTLIALLVICGILFLVGKLAISRLSNVRFGGGDGQAIKIVEKLQLDPRTSLYLVQVEGDRMLLGSGEKGVHLISRLDTTSNSIETDTGTKASFQEAMAKAGGLTGGSSAEEEDERQKEKSLDAG